jgi:hypothetical protein
MRHHPGRLLVWDGVVIALVTQALDDDVNEMATSFMLCLMRTRLTCLGSKLVCQEAAARFGQIPESVQISVPACLENSFFLPLDDSVDKSLGRLFIQRTWGPWFSHDENRSPLLLLCT